MRFFQDDAADPKKGKRRSSKLDDDLGKGKAFLCAHCRHRVTREAWRVDVAGHHTHTRVNPHGYRFTFGCFARVEGCVIRSAPSHEWSWFPGYSWQIENCNACGRHLGWCFDSGDHVFHGLVLERLVEGESD